MSLKYLDAPGPTLGMIRDVPSWQIPAGGVYDSLNLLYDAPGVARLRMGSTGLVTGAQTAFNTILGFCYSKDASTIEELYGINGKTSSSNGFLINKTTGASTLVAFGPAGIYGRPVRHFGFLCFPSASTTDSTYNSVWLAGQTNGTIYATTVASNIAAGNPQITLTGADVTTNIQVGAVVYGSTATNYYLGRVVSVDTAKLFTVWPTPTTTFSPGGTNLVTGPSVAQITTLMNSGGACAASFQNRMLFGGVNPQGTTPAVTPITRNDRRISYSLLPTERGGFNASGAKPIDGATFMWRDQYPALNYIDIPGADPIVALEPIDDNRLLILTSTHPVIFSGNLVTQLATTSPTVTFDLSDLNVPAGCLSDLSVQRTGRGIVWAGAGGVYALSGSTIRNLCGDDQTKRIASYWRSLASDATFVIHGSAYVRDHYIISGTSGGATFSLACNMANQQWTRLSGVGTDNFFAVARPSIPQQVFASRWWDQTGAAPSMTNGQTLRLDSMFKPYTVATSTTDADANPVVFSLTTPVLAGDPSTQKGFQRGTVRYQQASSTAATSVQARSGIDAVDTLTGLVTLGALSSTSTLTVTAATNANPIVCTTATHGLQTGDFVDILGGTGNTNVNGRWRINVLSATTFSLIGGIGNGAYGASSGLMRKVTEQDFQMTDLGRNQGVVFVIGAGVQVNNFEYHGARVAYLASQPVMST